MVRGTAPASSRPADPAEFDLVDPALLRPPDRPIRSGWRTDAAVVVDRELVSLAGVDARCRLIRARMAARLIATRAWGDLGFARLGDFCRERLGLAPRCLEQDAHMITALDALPTIGASLQFGEISWTRARLLLRVATPNNEARLLERSRGVSFRGLDAFVRGFEATDPPSDLMHAGATDQANHGDHGDSGVPDDPSIRWSIELSRSGRRMWRAASELASRSAGYPLSPAQVLELVAAEAASGAPGPESRNLHCEDRVAAAGPGVSWLPSPEDHASRLRARLRSRQRRGERFLLGFLAETGVAEGFAWLDPARLNPGPAATLDDLADGLDRADAFELDARLQRLRLCMQRIDAQMAALLRIGIDRRLFREIGYATVKLYAEARLGCSARKVWNLVAIERDSWRHSRRLYEAWHQGRLTSLQASALLPVLRERNAEAWIRRAGEVTLRRLHDEVAWALDHGRAPSASDAPMPPPITTAPNGSAGSCAVAASTSSTSSTSAPARDLPDPGLGDVCHQVFCDDGAEVSAERVQKSAYNDPADASLGPPGAVRLDFTIPLSVAVLVETTLDRVARGGDARWQAFERMVALALLEWAATPRHRDPVFERDGWRCSVPACSSRRNLHDHHILFRSRGGDNGRDNRVTVCAAHHLHGIHAGIVRGRGRAPDDITWELGCRPGRPPLLRLHGDRYQTARVSGPFP